MNFLLHLVFELACEIWTCIFGHVVARVYLDMCCGVEDGYLNTVFQGMKPSGLCFAGMLIHFRSGKFQVLDLSTF